MNEQCLTEKQRCEQCSFICSDRGRERPGKCSRYTCHTAPILISCIRPGSIGPMFGEHWHEQMQILYFKQGDISIHCNGNTYDLHAGDALIVNSNEIHYGTSHSLPALYYIFKIDFHELFLHLPPVKKSDPVARLQENRVFFENKINGDQFFTNQIEDILAECHQQTPEQELAIQAGVYRLLVHLLRTYQKKILPGEKTCLIHSFDQLRHVLQYMDQNYTENISLDDLSSLANMSPQHFCRLFKKLTGRRPTDYLNLLRINKSVPLLTNGHLNISQTATAVGFNDANYFSRVFKKYHAVSPAVFQQQYSNSGLF